MRRLGGDDLSISPDDRRRVLVLLVVSALCALLMVDYTRAPFVPLEVGDVAQRTVKAPFSFTFADHASHDRAKQAAGAYPGSVEMALFELMKSAEHERFRDVQAIVKELPLYDAEPALGAA